MLVTAAHVVDKSVARYVYAAGIAFHNLDNSLPGLTQGPRGSHSPCKIVDRLSSSDFSADIAILSVSGMNLKHWLPLAAMDIPDGELIEIVGYPGFHKDAWLGRKYPNFDDDDKETAKKLLPAGNLTVTKGQVVSTQNSVILSRMSTCPGFSGSPVLYKGKVCGI